MENNENTLGGALWVNLLNTIRYVDGKVIDLLNNRHLFYSWAVDNKLTCNVDSAQCEMLKELRKIFNITLMELSQGVPLEANIGLKKVNQVLESIPVIINVDYSKGGLQTILHSIDESNELSLQLLQSFLDTGRQYSFGKVRKCAHEECTLYFLDTSKSGKRKWCSMETCGNRKKASRHYNKTKTLPQ